MRCETWSFDEGRCGQPATTRLTQRAANMTALACDHHAARWMRTKKIRGQIVRVHPLMIAEPIAP